MVNYANGKIYKLVNNVDDEIYVGSTCNPLYKRKYGHKSESTKHPHLLKSQHFSRLGWENVEIILIENHPCESKQDLLKRERYWIDELKPSLNKALPYVSDAEKRETAKRKMRNWRNKPGNRDKRTINSTGYWRNYRERAEVQERSKERTTCECGKDVNKVKKRRHERSKQHQAWQKIYDFIHS